VGMIFQAPLPGGARLLADPLVRIRHGNSQWTPRAFEVWMLKWPALVWGLPGLDEPAKAAVTPREPWRRTFDLLLMKAKGCFSAEEYRRWLRPLPMGWLTRLRLRAIAGFPDVPFNALMRLVLPVLFPRARGTVIDLQRSRFDFRRRAGAAPGLEGRG